MHELSVTEGILKICIEESEKNKVKKIKKITIAVGEFTGLVPSSITYYFNIVSKGTIAEGAELLVNNIPLQISCSKCGYKGSINKDQFVCPKCNGDKYEIVNGNQCYVDTLEVE